VSVPKAPRARVSELAPAIAPGADGAGREEPVSPSPLGSRLPQTRL
jgi:hypothetical protein